MRLQSKKDVVRRFMAGASTAVIIADQWNGLLGVPMDNGLETRRKIEQILREFMRGEFTLEKRIYGMDGIEMMPKRPKAKRKGGKL